MKHATKLALAFGAFAALAAVPTAAQDRGPRGQERFERLDADSSGDISFEEFKAMFSNRIDLDEADADDNGQLTVAEIADHIQRKRAERAATRLIERFDANGDGELSVAEIEDRQQKRFALLDRNNDGKLTEEEMPRRMRGDRGRW